jgi:hypothetical protein
MLILTLTAPIESVTCNDGGLRTRPPPPRRPHRVRRRRVVSPPSVDLNFSALTSTLGWFVAALQDNAKSAAEMRSQMEKERAEMMMRFESISSRIEDIARHSASTMADKIATLQTTVEAEIGAVRERQGAMEASSASMQQSFKTLESLANGIVVGEVERENNVVAMRSGIDTCKARIAVLEKEMAVAKSETAKKAEVRQGGGGVTAQVHQVVDAKVAEVKRDVEKLKEELKNATPAASDDPWAAMARGSSLDGQLAALDATPSAGGGGDAAGDLGASAVVLTEKFTNLEAIVRRQGEGLMGLRDQLRGKFDLSAGQVDCTSSPPNGIVSNFSSVNSSRAAQRRP